MDIEKLLGKLLNEVKDSGGDKVKKKYKEYKKDGKKKAKQYKKDKKKAEKRQKKEHYYRGSRPVQDSTSGKGSLINNLTSSMTSGKGLLTAIGLGVGAYEIYRSSRKPQTPVGSPPPTLPRQPVASPPPLPPRPAQGQNQTEMPPQPSVPKTETGTAEPPIDTSVETSVEASVPEPVVTRLDEQETARRLIQVMVGAAHADGTLDAEEEKAILERLRELELDQEEKMFLLGELHNPLTIAELTSDIDDPRIGQTMYAVAASTLIVDTESERQWLDDLGAALGISPDLRQFIEEHH